MSRPLSSLSDETGQHSKFTVRTMAKPEWSLWLVFRNVVKGSTRTKRVALEVGEQPAPDHRWIVGNGDVRSFKSKQYCVLHGYQLPVNHVSIATASRDKTRCSGCPCGALMRQSSRRRQRRSPVPQESDLQQYCRQRALPKRARASTHAVRGLRARQNKRLQVPVRRRRGGASRCTLHTSSPQIGRAHV